MQAKIDRYENQFLKAQKVYRELFQKNEEDVLTELKAERSEKMKKASNKRIQINRAHMMLQERQLRKDQIKQEEERFTNGVDPSLIFKNTLEDRNPRRASSATHTSGKRNVHKLMMLQHKASYVKEENKKQR